MAVEGQDLAHLVLGGPGVAPQSALMLSIAPFCESIGPEWRGVRTERYTYVETLQGAWLLYDNQADPYQLNNLVSEPAYEAMRASLAGELRAWLARTHDEFLPAHVYRERYGLVVDERFAVPYTD